MTGNFEAAGLSILRRLETGLHSAGVQVMRESLVECPLSDGETYIPQYITRGSGPGRELIFLGDDPTVVGDNGTLRRSARVFKTVVHGNEMTVEIGYGFGAEVNPAGRVAAEYAVPVHERSELRHMPPTKDHYLLDPMNAFATHFGATMREAVKSDNAAESRDVTGSDLGA